jgi:hypothetical protein
LYVAEFAVFCAHRGGPDCFKYDELWRMWWTMASRSVGVAVFIFKTCYWQSVYFKLLKTLKNALDFSKNNISSSWWMADSSSECRQRNLSGMTSSLYNFLLDWNILNYFVCKTKACGRYLQSLWPVSNTYRELGNFWYNKNRIQ